MIQVFTSVIKGAKIVKRDGSVDYSISGFLEHWILRLADAAVSRLTDGVGFKFLDPAFVGSACGCYRGSCAADFVRTRKPMAEHTIVADIEQADPSFDGSRKGTVVTLYRNGSRNGRSQNFGRSLIQLGRYKNLDPTFVGSAYLFLKKKKDIRLRWALG